MMLSSSKMWRDFLKLQGIDSSALCNDNVFQAAKAGYIKHLETEITKLKEELKLYDCLTPEDKKLIEKMPKSVFDFMKKDTFRVPKELSEDDIKAICTNPAADTRSLVSWHHYIIKHFTPEGEMMEYKRRALEEREVSHIQKILVWMSDIKKLKAESRKLKEAMKKSFTLLKGIDDYLNPNPLNSICTSSIGHKELKESMKLLTPEGDRDG